jgi:hypothetical protein
VSLHNALGCGVVKCASVLNRGNGWALEAHRHKNRNISHLRYCDGSNAKEHTVHNAAYVFIIEASLSTNCPPIVLREVVPIALISLVLLNAVVEGDLPANLHILVPWTDSIHWQRLLFLRRSWPHIVQLCPTETAASALARTMQHVMHTSIVRSLLHYIPMRRQNVCDLSLSRHSECECPFEVKVLCQ